MNRFGRRLMHRHFHGASDRGFTLIEGLIAMVIFTTVLSVMTSVMAGMVKQMRHAEGVSIATDKTRVAFNRLDKEVRYASSISTGVGDDGTGWYAELRLPHEEQGADRLDECRQWRLKDNTLATRKWLVKKNGNPLNNAKPQPGGYLWTTVATNVTNSDTQPPFLLSPPNGGLHKGLVVDLHTRNGTADGPAHLQATFYARNTVSWWTSSPPGCDQPNVGGRN